MASSGVQARIREYTRRAANAGHLAARGRSGASEKRSRQPISLAEPLCFQQKRVTETAGCILFFA